ncbi:hypothetical protein ACGE0T_14325 [Parabacteroides sp. APC149_11_2_Y6]
MAGKGGSLGELYFSITGEDRLEEILRKDKKLAEEVAKIAGGIQIGRTRVTQDRAREILKEANAFEEAAKGADKFNAAQERLRKKQAAGEFKEYIQDLTRVSDAQRQMTAYYKELEKELGNNQGAIGSIKMLEAELRKLKDTYRSLSETDRNSILGKTMLTQINNADQNLAKINAEMANNAALAKTMGTQYNGLRTQISMVARELPNLGISLSTFIISLSNNLPYLADEIAKANKEFNELKKTSQAATPVWKQMIGAIFNWQTALIVGITVLTAYSREIQAWVQELIKGNSAASILADTQKFLNELHEEAAKGASKELSQLQLLYGVTQDATRTVKERTAATEQLQKLFPDYFGKLSSEAILVGNAQAAYDALAISIKNSEKARRINMENAALNEAEIKAIQERREAEEQLAEAGKELERQRKLPWIINYQGIEDAELAYGHYLEKVERANSKIEGIQESRKKLLESYKSDVTTNLKVPFEKMSEYEAYQKTISKLDRLLSMSVINQEEYNKRLNDAKGILIDAADAAEVGGTRLEEFRKEYIEFNKIQLQNKDKTKYIDEYKERQDIEKANQALKDAITKSEIDIEQARINLMEQGSIKTLAQIKLDYKKRNVAIEKEARDSIEKIKKIEREQWEKDNPNYQKNKKQFTSITELIQQLKVLGNQMNSTFGKGNVDLLTRPLVDAAELAKKGWEDAGEGIATVFSSSYQLTQKGEEVMVHVTPILPDGKILSPKELEQYIDTTLNDAEDILQADNKKNGGLGVVLNVDTNLSDKIAENFGEGLHLAQEKYYDLLQKIQDNPLNINIGESQQKVVGQLAQSSRYLKKETEDLVESLTYKWSQYADKRQAIEIDFNNKVKQIEQDRVSIGYELANKALEKAQNDRKNALEELEQELFSLTDIYRKVFGDISELTLSTLKDLVSQSEKIISTAKGKFNDKGELIGYTVSYDGKAFELAVNQLDRFRKKIVELKQDVNKEDPFGALANYATDFIKSLKDVEKAQQEVELAKNGAGTIVGSNYDKETNKITLNLKSQKQAEDELSDAISNREKSLKGIGNAANSVGQIVQGLTNDWANMFSALGNEDMADTLGAIGEIAGQVGKLAQDLASGNPVQQAVGVLSFVPNIIGSIAQLHDKRLDKAIKRSQLEVQKLQGSYEDLERLIDRQLGAVTEDQAKQQIENLRLQREELYKQMQAESDKKKSDEGAVEDYKKQIKELDDQIQYFYEDLAGEQFGINIKDWAGQIADALTEAFAKGEDAAEAFDDTVASIMKSVFKNVIQLQYIEPAMKKLREYLFGTNGAGGVLGDGDLSSTDMNGLVKELMGFKDKINESQKLWDILNDAAEEAGVSLVEEDKKKKEGLSQSIQGVTEDTANVLGSYLNAIRADVSANRADVSANRVNLQKLVDNAVPFYNDFALHVANLKHLETIAVNTGRNADIVGRIENILTAVTQPGSGRKFNIQ